MAKRTMPKGLTRQIIAGANPAAGAKQFAMPRSSEDLSLANLGLDFIDWTPAAPVAYGVDVASGDQEFSPLMAGLLTIPLVGPGAKKLKKVSDFVKLFPEGQFSKSSIKAAEKLDPEFIKFTNNQYNPTAIKTEYQLRNLATTDPEAYQLLAGKYGYNKQFEKGVDNVLKKPANYDNYTPKEQIGYELAEVNKFADMNGGKQGTALTPGIKGILPNKNYMINSEKYLTFSDIAKDDKQRLMNAMANSATPDPNSHYNTILNFLEANPEFDYRLADQRILKESANPVTSMDQFTDKSTGIMSQAKDNVLKSDGSKRSYNHSRPFNGGTFQVLNPIDRQTTIKNNNYDLGSRMFDAQMYVNPNDEVKLKQFVYNEEFPKRSTLDPYYEAGIINDENVKLNRLIDAERARGLTDEAIYAKYRHLFDKYQGMLDRYKTRINSKKSNFVYDGAITNYIRATPSEKIDVMRKLGIDPESPNAEAMLEKYKQFYDDLLTRYRGIDGIRPD